MKKKLVTVIAALLVVCMFTACSGAPAQQSAEASKAPEASAPASATSAAPAATEDPTQISANLTMWTGTWNQEKMDGLLEKFHETYPNINVNIEYGPWDGMEDKYLASMQAGTIPDIIDMAIAWTIPYAKMGNLIAVDDLAAKYGLDLNATYYEGGLETSEVDGKHYALPYRTEVMALIYNKDLFTQAGLDPEKGPATWDELVQDGKAITALGNGTYGFGLCGYGTGNLTAQVYSLMFSNGVELLNEDGTKAAFNTPQGAEALEYWANLKDISPTSALENDNTTNRNLFAEGKLGMYVSGSYDLAAIHEANPNINLGFCIFPQFKSEFPVKCQQGGWNIGMTKECTDDEKDAAFLWIKFLASPEISVTFSDTISACKEAIDDPKYSDPEMKVFLDSLQYGKPVPGNINMNAITTVLYNESQAVLSGIKDAATALKDAETQVNELLAG